MLKARDFKLSHYSWKWGKNIQQITPMDSFIPYSNHLIYFMEGKNDLKASWCPRNRVTVCTKNENYIEPPFKQLQILSSKKGLNGNGTCDLCDARADAPATELWSYNTCMVGRRTESPWKTVKAVCQINFKLSLSATTYQDLWLACFPSQD